MNKRRFLNVVLALSVFSCAAIPSSSVEGNQTEPSYQTARRVLDAAIAAHGGLEALQRVEAVSVKMSGRLYHRNQSLRADGPLDTTPFAGEVIRDFQRNWLLFERTSSYPGGFHFSNRWLLKQNKGVNLNLLTKQFARLNDASGFVENISQRFPHHVLLAALSRAGTLRSLGRGSFQNRPQDVITYAGPTGAQMTLFVDAESHRLSKFEQMVDDTVAGDAVAELIYADYQPIGGLPMPMRFVQQTAGEMTLEVRYSDFKLGAPPAESLFDLPPGYTEFPAPPPASGVRELTTDVYLIDSNGYGIMFVAFDEYVLVVEAPLGEAASRTAIEKIRQTVPNKPSRYVAVTHHHDDHAGGVRMYFAEGITLVTTPGNRRYFERVAAARHTIQPDSLARRPRPPVIETISDKKRVFRDARHVVELYDIGPGPHAEEMVIAYLPNEKLLFQGDLLNLPPDGRPRVPANETTVHFYETLQKMGLPVAKLTGVHSPVVGMETLVEAIEMRKRAEMPTRMQGR